MPILSRPRAGRVIRAGFRARRLAELEQRLLELHARRPERPVHDDSKPLAPAHTSTPVLEYGAYITPPRNQAPGAFLKALRAAQSQGMWTDVNPDEYARGIREREWERGSQNMPDAP